jgi:pimeloyl-ACP methyl ester carboxylesterase
MSTLGEHFRGGHGDPLLLVHGFTGTWRVWGPVVPALAEHFDVLAPNLPGHVGGPPFEPPRTIAGLAERVEAMLDDVGWEQPHVAGFSLGGWLALELAKRLRARSVTAISPAGALLWCGPRERKRFQRQFRVNRALAQAAMPLVGLVVRPARVRRVIMRDSMVDGGRMPAQDAAAVLRDHVATPAFHDILAAFDREGLTGLERVDVPVHVWWGKRDRILPLRHAPYFEGGLRGATFEYVEAAGHVPFWEAPEAIVDAIRATAARAGQHAPAPI